MLTQEEKIDMLCAVFRKALEVNGLERRKSSLSGSAPTVFFKWSGHVASVDITVHPDGWVPDSDGIDVEFYAEVSDSAFAAGCRAAMKMLEGMKK